MSFQDVNIAELKKFDCKAEICKLWIMGQLSLTTFFFFFFKYLCVGTQLYSFVYIFSMSTFELQWQNWKLVTDIYDPQA